MHIAGSGPKLSSWPLSEFDRVRSRQGMTANGATMVTPLGATTTYATKDDGYGGIKLTNAFMPRDGRAIFRRLARLFVPSKGRP